MTFGEIEELISNTPSALGRLVVATERGTRAYVLGTRTQLDGEPPVLDWRTAPLGEAFFRYAPGEPYEIAVGEHVVAGTVRERCAFVGRPHLRAVIADDRVLTRDGERALRPQPAPAEHVDRSALPTLDPEQQRAVDLPADTSLVLDGEAGVGKTLVALFRVAALEQRARQQSRKFRALVLVPTEGLRRLVRILAERLGIQKLEIAVVDAWLLERGHAGFPGLPKRTSSGATASVIGLKRHPAVRAVLDDFIGWKPPHGVENDDKIARSRMRLLHLFGDRDRLQRVLDAAGGALPAYAIAAAMQHTRIQFETTTERANRHVDADRLVALDNRALDAGTPTEDANTFDAEDVPVLFELARRGALPLGKLAHYDHIVVDEAQLRSPLELAMIGDALAEHGTVTLAGDHRQATDESAWFAGWDAARNEVRRPRWDQTTLAITYRSVPAISAFARSIVSAAQRFALLRTPAEPGFADGGARVPPEPPTDPAVWASACDGALVQAAQLCWHLDALLARDPWRQICVIGRTPEHARRLHGELSRGLDPQLVLDGDFRFEPGIIVTAASAISGLEFDTVVIPDLTPAFYPRTPELARLLYVAATRARDWLWLTTPDAWSPLVA